MPLQKFQIILDKKYFSAGELLKGKFVLVVVGGSYQHNGTTQGYAKTFIVHQWTMNVLATLGIVIKLEGAGAIKWTDVNTCFEDKSQRARKLFFETGFNYVPGAVLKEGSHVFPFEYKLPDHLPSSLQTRTITIYYKIEIIINKPNNCRRQVLIFPLKGSLNLNNLDAQITKPIFQIKSKNLLFLCNYVSIGMKLNRQAFTHNEHINCCLAVFNNSLKLINSTLSLTQEISVMTLEKTMIERRTIVKIKLQDFEPENTTDYRKYEHIVQIPNDIVINSHHNQYVNIQCFLKFSVEASKFPYQTLTVIIPITIGSVRFCNLDDGSNGNIYCDGGGGGGDRSNLLLPKIIIQETESINEAVAEGDVDAVGEDEENEQKNKKNHSNIFGGNNSSSSSGGGGGRSALVSDLSKIQNDKITKKCFS